MKQLIEKAIQFQLDHKGFPNGLPDELTLEAFAPLYNHLHGYLDDGSCHWMAYIRDKVREYDEKYLNVSDEDMDAEIKKAVGKDPLKLKV